MGLTWIHESGLNNGFDGKPKLVLNVFFEKLPKSMVVVQGFRPCMLSKI